MPLDLAILAVSLLLGSLVLAVFFNAFPGILLRVGFSVAAGASLLAAFAGAWTVAAERTLQLTLPLGLPDLPFHLRLDPLSGFFLSVVGLLGLMVSVYSLGYVKGFVGKRPITSLVVFYCLFLAGMFMVVLADDALFFLISWEIMAAASYFLVLFEDERAANRRAAFIYMLVAHVGAIAILLSFGIMAGLSTGFRDFGAYTFDAMRAAQIPPGWATAAFLLAFFGFAAKAGMIPLHVWLPEAHPVAPSNVSALMSGVMLKTAIYGMVRVTFDLLDEVPWWCGALVLTLGLVSAVLGVLYAIMQNDLKKLLAYSSVENIGIILVGVGLSMTFRSFELPMLAALALIAALYHVLNHAMFKGLLFMGAGAVLHATHERNMENMGGLIHLMPWTAAIFLVGCASISALPPLNGFVSEWLTFQAFLLSPSLPVPLMKLIIPLGAALLALTGALAAACFVKAYGVVFLGHWRGRRRAQIHEVDWFMRGAMLLTAVACLTLGILPTTVIGWLDAVTEQLIQVKVGGSAGAFGWMWLTPIAAERASYSGLIVFLVILATIAIVYALLHVKPGRIRRAPVWDCGFEKLTPRMQYTSTAFSMPIRRIFGFLFSIREESASRTTAGHAVFPRALSYRLRLVDRVWKWAYQPVADMSFWLARQVGKLQQGRIQAYLIYSFVTIIVLLLLVQ